MQLKQSICLSVLEHFCAIIVDKSCCIGTKPEAARTAALAGSRAPGGAGGPGQDQGNNVYSLFEP